RVGPGAHGRSFVFTCVELVGITEPEPARGRRTARIAVGGATGWADIQRHRDAWVLSLAGRPYRLLMTDRSHAARGDSATVAPRPFGLTRSVETINLYRPAARIKRAISCQNRILI